MSLFVGDNFKYGGRKFLDDRQSFNTLEEMKNYTKVPEGFITYCKETEKRYEYKSSNTIDELTGLWAEYSVSTTFDGDVFYIGSETPEDENDLWFSPGVQGSSSGITMDNPIIAELFACIATMQKQILQLQEEVEYLKIHGGGGEIPDVPDFPDFPDIPDVPDNPDKPDNPDEPIISDVFLLLEEGGFFELEDGGFLLSEEVSIVIPSIAVITLEDGGFFELEEGGYLLTEDQPIVQPSTSSISVITLEDGGFFELEEGGYLLTEEQPTVQPSASIITLENGGFFELETGGFLLTENQPNNQPSNIDDKKAAILLENGSNLLLENGSLMLLEKN